MKNLKETTKTVPSSRDRFMSFDPLGPNEERLIINIAAGTVLRQGVRELTNTPNTLVSIRWTDETLDWHSDRPLYAVVRIPGGAVWLDETHGWVDGSTTTHVYDISELTRQDFPAGSIAAQHGYAGTHWAGRAQRLIQWEGC